MRTKDSRTVLRGLGGSNAPRLPGGLARKKEAYKNGLPTPYSNDLQRVIVRMPNGFEYREMEVAQTGILKGTGAIRYDWQKTHSSLAEVEHTPVGLAS